MKHNYLRPFGYTPNMRSALAITATAILFLLGGVVAVRGLHLTERAIFVPRLSALEAERGDLRLGLPVYMSPEWQRELEQFRTKITEEYFSINAENFKWEIKTFLFDAPYKKTGSPTNLSTGLVFSLSSILIIVILVLVLRSRKLSSVLLVFSSLLFLISLSLLWGSFPREIYVRAPIQLSDSTRNAILGEGLLLLITVYIPFLFTRVRGKGFIMQKRVVLVWISTLLIAILTWSVLAYVRNNQRVRIERQRVTASKTDIEHRIRKTTADLRLFEPSWLPSPTAVQYEMVFERNDVSVLRWLYIPPEASPFADEHVGLAWDQWKAVGNLEESFSEIERTRTVEKIMLRDGSPVFFRYSSTFPNGTYWLRFDKNGTRIEFFVPVTYHKDFTKEELLRVLESATMVQ